MENDEKALYDRVDDMFAAEKKKAKSVQDEEVADLVFAAKSVLATIPGRKIFWWILKRGNLFASTYTGKALDQAHIDGSRIIAAEAFSLALKANPRILELMINDQLTLTKEV